MWIHFLLLMMCSILYYMYLQTGNTYQDKINTICPKSPLQEGEWYKSKLASGIQNDRISSEKSQMNEVWGWVIMHSIYRWQGSECPFHQLEYCTIFLFHSLLYVEENILWTFPKIFWLTEFCSTIEYSNLLK